jgi:nucleotide-binding universal stress UspA family protein
MVVAVVVLAWVVVGLGTGLVEARRGHWSKSWALYVIFGPFAVPLALTARQREAEAHPQVLSPGDERPGALDVLVGVDGSPASLAAATAAAGWFGSQIGRMALATVLDYDTATPHADSTLSPQPWDEERVARSALESAAEIVSGQVGLTPASVILAGRAPDALESYAAEHDYDLLIVGCRGHGLSKSILGSCASRLARRSRVPVLLVPEPVPGSTTVPRQLADARERH